jgi:hypothetical protein
VETESNRREEDGEKINSGREILAGVGHCLKESRYGEQQSSR